MISILTVRSYLAFVAHAQTVFKSNEIIAKTRVSGSESVHSDSNSLVCVVATPVDDKEVNVSIVVGDLIDLVVAALTVDVSADIDSTTVCHGTAMLVIFL